MRRLKYALLLIFILGCEAPSNVSESADGLQLAQGTRLELVLTTALSSESSRRLDAVEAQLRKTIQWRGEKLLPAGTLIRGFVKRAERFDNRGQRAALGLVFDQVVLADGNVLPLLAELDTDQDAASIRIQGEALRNTQIISHSALAGSMIGDAVLPGQGAQKGIAIGSGLGSSALFLSREKRIDLPAGTEISLRLTNPLLLPRPLEGSET